MSRNGDLIYSRMKNDLYYVGKSDILGKEIMVIFGKQICSNPTVYTLVNRRYVPCMKLEARYR